MAVILFDSAEPFEQFGNTLLTEGPMRNLVKIAQEIEIHWFKNRHLKITQFYSCILSRVKGRYSAPPPPPPKKKKILIITNMFYYFNHPL